MAKYSGSNQNKQDEPLWLRCSNCRDLIYRRIFDENFHVCPHCDFHYRLSAGERIKYTFDDRGGSFKELFKDINTRDFIGFKIKGTNYGEIINKNKERSGQEEACIAGVGKINGSPVASLIFDFNFLGGSMGFAVGEKVKKIFEYSRRENLPVLAVTASGGARMHEGMISLMQMSKTVLAATRFTSKTNKPFICLMTNPTTGGVLASFASLADIIFAEPGALIGFAGPRVIEKTVRVKLPKNFQRSEFLLEKGLIDGVVKRNQLRELIKGYLI